MRPLQQNFTHYIKMTMEFEDKLQHLAPVVQKVDNAIQRINLYPLDSIIINNYQRNQLLVPLIVIHWIVIYAVDSAIQLLNNWALDNKQLGRVGEGHWAKGTGTGTLYSMAFIEMCCCTERVGFSSSVTETRGVWNSISVMVILLETKYRIRVFGLLS